MRSVWIIFHFGRPRLHLSNFLSHRLFGQGIQLHISNLAMPMPSSKLLQNSHWCKRFDVFVPSIQKLACQNLLFSSFEAMAEASFTFMMVSLFLSQAELKFDHNKTRQLRFNFELCMPMILMRRMHALWLYMYHNYHIFMSDIVVITSLDLTFFWCSFLSQKGRPQRL